MLKVEIDDGTIYERKGVSKKTGEAYCMRSQNAWVYTIGQNGLPNRHPQKMEINLEDGQAGYAPGFYFVSDSSLYTDRFNRLTAGRVALMLPQVAVEHLKAQFEEAKSFLARPAAAA